MQPQHFVVEPGGRLRGRLRVPGDKSISHRSVMLASLADGTSTISGFLNGADCLATIRAFRAMAVAIDGPDQDRVSVHGVGLHGLRAPPGPLDMGNAGTAMRLIAGILSAQDFATTLIGDTSLSKRPMRRITEPLGLMGARIETSANGTAPLLIHGGQVLHGIDYRLPIASAQVKSCLLLAGLYARGTTRVTEPAPSRDHTERMLEAFGYRLHRADTAVSVPGEGRLTATNIEVPADISSAAFFLVGASIAPGSDVILEHVGLNPTRNGMLAILRLMGADIKELNPRQMGTEPVADLRVRYAPLKGVIIPPELVPLAIDEFPVLFVAAACAHGETVLTGAAELRAKESDRIQVMADGLRQLGVAARPTPDGIIINGGRLGGGVTIETHHDHRIAMSFSMAALAATGALRIRDSQFVDTSFPGFARLAAEAGLGIRTGQD